MKLLDSSSYYFPIFTQWLNQLWRVIRALIYARGDKEKCFCTDSDQKYSMDYWPKLVKTNGQSFSVLDDRPTWLKFPQPDRPLKDAARQWCTLLKICWCDKTWRQCVLYKSSKFKSAWLIIEIAAELFERIVIIGMFDSGPYDSLYWKYMLVLLKLLKGQCTMTPRMNVLQSISWYSFYCLACCWS